MSNSDTVPEKSSDDNLNNIATNSENNDANTSLIEKILCEMKNEFNRSMDEVNICKTEPTVKDASNSSEKKTTKELGRKSVSKTVRTKNSADASAESSKSSVSKSHNQEISSTSNKVKTDSVSKAELISKESSDKVEKTKSKGSSSRDSPKNELGKGKKSEVAAEKKTTKPTTRRRSEKAKPLRSKASVESKISSFETKNSEISKSKPSNEVSGVEEKAAANTSALLVECSKITTLNEVNATPVESELIDPMLSLIETKEPVPSEPALHSASSDSIVNVNKEISLSETCLPSESKTTKDSGDTPICEEIVETKSNTNVPTEVNSLPTNGEEVTVSNLAFPSETDSEKEIVSNSASTSKSDSEKEFVSSVASTSKYDDTGNSSLCEVNSELKAPSQNHIVNDAVVEKVINDIVLNIQSDETKEIGNLSNGISLDDKIDESKPVVLEPSEPVLVSSEILPISEKIEEEEKSTSEHTNIITPKENVSVIDSPQEEIFVKAESNNEVIYETVKEKIESIISSVCQENISEPSDPKPRIILTLKTTEEQRNCSPLKQGSESHESKGKSIQYSILIKESLTKGPEEGSIVNSGSQLSSNDGEESKVGQVFRTRDISKSEIDTSIKRSSRRTSKEFSFESVLQTAIARKEKSFGALNGLEERIKRDRLARYGSSEVRSSPRISKSKSPKPTNINKSGDSSLQTSIDFNPMVICDAVPQNNVKSSFVSSNIKDDNNLPHVLETMKEVTEQTAKNPVKSEPSSVSVFNGRAGRKRKRYFKGFRYSLKSGVAKLVARSKKPKTEGQSNSIPSGKDELPPDEVPLVQTLKTEPNESISENSSSTISSDSNQCAGVKRKYSGKEENLNGAEKLRRTDIPSPSTAEVSEVAAAPESTAISVGGGTAAICLCQVNERVYVSPVIVKEANEIYCQAIDSLDNQKIGCCNVVDKDDKEVVMLRPSVRIPYQPFCHVHFQRLIRHNCCPGCGLFCTQGRFVQCESFHQYHRECELMLDGKPTCPHCGQDSPKTDVLLSIGEHKNPIFFPLQKPPKKVPSARICLGNSTSQQQMSEAPPSPTILPPTSLILPNGAEVSSEGMPPSLDKDKLDELLHAASKSSFLDARVNYRTLYQAAKNGETEKVLAALAAGLNPNHLFREWVMGSALHGSCVGGHLGTVHVLVQAGAQLDVIDRDQNTPLMLAAMHSQNEVVKYLIKAGASITFKGEDGMTVLHIAARAGNLEACHYILNNTRIPPNFINLTDDGGWTPLVWAAEHCHTTVVEYLLEKRADAHIRDSEQNIALHWATFSGSVNITELLLDYGSELNSTNTHGDTPLHIAARRNHYNCVILLLARGAVTHVKNKAGFTVLESCVIQPSDTFRALNLNSKLQELTAKTRERTQLILNTDITRGHEKNPVQCINGVDDELEPTDFIYVTENCFTSNISVDRTITSLRSCTCNDCSTSACSCGKISFRCWYDKDGRLNPDFNYNDPPMLFECNQACKCNKVLCQNRVVQKGLTARFQLFRAKENKGWGVSTLKLIPKGTYVCEYIGEIISDCEADTREDDSYLFDLDNRDDETYCIDARRYGNIARFINHSCVPNLQPVRVFIGHQDLHFPRIAFFANRDIQPHEELGFDYGEKFWIIKYKSFTCTCKAKNCRYSVTTIQNTLDNYNKKIQELENSQ